MKKIALDTNAYTALLTGDRVIVLELAEADKIYLSVIVLGELYTGFLGGSKSKQNRELLNTFLQKQTVFVQEVNKETAMIFAEIKHRLQKAGTPLPINDLWIAANALETGAMLLTYDRHFSKIDGLRHWDRV